MQTNRSRMNDFVIAEATPKAQINPQITVRAPNHTPFKLHPYLSLGKVWMVYLDGDWFLISNDVGNREFIERKTKGTLYPAITDDGNLFILVVVDPWPGYPDTWKRSADEIVTMAQRGWVTMRSNKEAKCFECDWADISKTGRWPNGLNEEALINAFGDRIIDRDNYRNFQSGNLRADTFDS